MIKFLREVHRSKTENENTIIIDLMVEAEFLWVLNNFLLHFKLYTHSLVQIHLYYEYGHGFQVKYYASAEISFLHKLILQEVNSC